MKVWLTLYQKVVKVFGDRYKGSMEKNGTYGVSGMLWVIREGVCLFFGEGVVLT